MIAKTDSYVNFSSKVKIPIFKKTICQVNDCENSVIFSGVTHTLRHKDGINRWVSNSERLVKGANEKKTKTLPFHTRQSSVDPSFSSKHRPYLALLK